MKTIEIHENKLNLNDKNMMSQKFETSSISINEGNHINHL
jgi:hypothetical protein